MQLIRNILLCLGFFIGAHFGTVPNAKGAAQVPVVTPPVYCPPDASGHVNPFPCSPSVVIGPAPLRCLAPDAPMNNPTCPAVRAKVARYRADNAIIAVLLTRKRGCFRDWPSVVVVPPAGLNKTYKRCGRVRGYFKSALRSIRDYVDDAYIQYATDGMPAGQEPGVQP